MPRWWTRGSRYEFMGRGWRVANCRRYSVGYAPANVCLSAPTEFLVALHIARMSAAINYLPNVTATSEYFQPEYIFENAIDQETSRMSLYGASWHADFLGRNKLSRSRDFAMRTCI